MMDRIRNGQIRYCDSNKEEYLIIGRTPLQKNAFRVLWRTGLRSHDDISDIKHDKVVGNIDNFRASNKDMLLKFVRKNVSR